MLANPTSIDPHHAAHLAHLHDHTIPAVRRLVDLDFWHGLLADDVRELLRSATRLTEEALCLTSASTQRD